MIGQKNMANTEWGKEKGGIRQVLFLDRGTLPAKIFKGWGTRNSVMGAEDRKQKKRKAKRDS